MLYFSAISMALPRLRTARWRSVRPTPARRNMWLS
jgi:hypothetical protein